MDHITHNHFTKEVTCDYRGETYTVRDNGAVFRHRRKEGRRRPLDEEWTFGRVDKDKGYMKISSVSVHRIVATAFHGEQPSGAHVVDHIDTNRQNNRPENLRWVTRLENILLNPITARRVEIAYGSIENFLKNPGQPLPGKLNSDFAWMRTVTKQEASNSYKRLLDWAKSGSIPSGGVLSEWLYKVESNEVESDDLTDSQTPGAIQKNWKTPSEFPFCPSSISSDALKEYLQHLTEGSIFSRNRFGESKTVTAALSENPESLLVLCTHPGGVKDWSLSRVIIDDQLFVHENLGTFFSLEGAKKEFTLALGLEWEGGDTIDDLS